MKMILELPEEFREHFNRDKFQDSFMRICGDINEICKSHCYPCSESLGLSGNLEKELVDVLKDAFKSADELNQGTCITVSFYRMMKKKPNDYFSGFGFADKNYIEMFASKITVDNGHRHYWKLVKDNKTIAREAIYLGE
jgi:hypothetical protein